jgi:threonine/homoserine/homoserine lactone efflux protein
MEVIFTFAIAFFFSFVGTIPPGTLNLTIIQLGLDHRINIAWRMAIAASLIEYPYAWLAIEFQDFVTRSAGLIHSFQLITGVVMILLGAFNLWTTTSTSGQSNFSKGLQESGFRKGLLLGLLNPLAVPFWMATTAYSESHGWIDLSGPWEFHAYLLGVSTGTLVLCMLLAYLAKLVVSRFQTYSFLQKIPGIILLLLGTYALAEYIFP